ncbi:MAG: endonuclease/exonuclease/phosphatase family protein [Cyclobacteriaceae bacterium]|nr:endonuclease/exonuclease/phosphatase family protein [Cyclobacteriaceae bacterium]
MRIIEWNCQGAFRKKNSKILAHNPDILIVPECENERKLQFGKLTPKPNDFFWHGDSENKGIGIFSYSDYSFELLKCFNPRFRYIIPLKVTGSGKSFLLFAIWAMDNKENERARYIGQIWLAINYYSNYLNNDSIFIGDFNSNQIWDANDRVGNHTDMVNFLMKKNIHSLYHSQEQSDQGKENEATFFMYRKKEKPYHIDYCFASDSIISNGFKLSIENINKWIEISDHVPMIVDLISLNESSINDFSLAYFVKDKLNQLFPSTQQKFTHLISELIVEASQTDQQKDSKEIESKRQSIIKKIDYLFEIDTLVNKIENGC